MRPIGLLMIEHRLIERMVMLLGWELRIMKKTGKVNTNFIREGADFFRTYADLTHHGKEEGILFKNLFAKTLTNEHQELMQQLTQEHVWAGQAVHKLSESNELLSQGDSAALTVMICELGKIVEFYPKHIEKEDKYFFIPVMGYFNGTEQEAMLEEFREFDRTMIHKRYDEVVAKYESKNHGLRNTLR